MANVADTLITKFELQDNYSGKLKNISKQTDDLGKSIGNVTGGGSGSGGGIGSLVSGLGTIGSMAPGIGTAVTMIATALTAVATATVGATVAAAKFGMEAMKAAAPMDTIERTFAGVYGSTKKAADMMAYLKGEAMKSNFEFKDLADSAKMLVMNGMKFSEFKDPLQAIAMRGSGDPTENLRMVTSTLTRIKAGDFAQAFENLRSFGIGKDTLVAMGATFDKSGQFTGNVAQALALFKKLGQESQGVVDTMDGGMEATLGNMEEGFGLMMQQAGKQIFADFKPLIDNIITAITDVLDSGIIKDTIDSISSMFDVDPGSNGLAKLVIGVLAAIRTGAWIVRSVWAGIEAVVGYVASILKYIPGMGGIGGVGAFVNPFGLTGSIASEVGSYYKNSYDEMSNTFAASQAMKAKKEGNQAEPDGAKLADNSPAPTLVQIAQNTKATAEHTKQQADMSRHIFGGGDLGRLGLSPAELDNFTGSRRSGRTTLVRIVGMGSFDQMFTDVINQVLPQLKRQGAI